MLEVLGWWLPLLLAALQQALPCLIQHLHDHCEGSACFAFQSVVAHFGKMWYAFGKRSYMILGTLRCIPSLGHITFSDMVVTS